MRTVTTSAPFITPTKLSLRNMDGYVRHGALKRETQNLMFSRVSFCSQKLCS